ncbi:MAG: DUF1206 domain-containing protein [Brevundimonas sp.]|uniref:DUF1206 domain-containing protein n=1 Tax=Brevundimonas sp. TaxID=1871086 RepID=UPI00263423E4|nr:DUF1206 domain-containing protein [Brevundimonas sp.]MDI6624968.1 DUF1206 domain-containing protein [Brevundimonas sp.]MDQ7813524.1 DUF1206 domain-containing protein [Brevundimonas sp.]
MPPLQDLLELAARVGYGARGFVYLSVGLLVLFATLGLVGDTVGIRGALEWLSKRPLGRLWMLMIGLGLTAFVMWRVLQSVFDADHEGTSRDGLMTRAGQLTSGLAYTGLAFAAFVLFAGPRAEDPSEGVVESRERAAMLLDLPFGRWLLIAAGLTLFGIGVANVVKAWREDFSEYLDCSVRMCRRVTPMARIGHVARGLAYLPLAGLVTLAGWNARAAEVTSFGAALERVEQWTAGAWIIGFIALGFVAFGLFAFIEARFRRIRPPRDIKHLP